MSKPRNYTKICLTGGPCSGKTSALSAIKHQFSQKYTVYEVPEVGTIAFTAGVNLLPSAYTPEEHKVFTHAICKAQIDLEAYFEQLAELQKRPVLIITDRGVSDNFAYTQPENKKKILQENKWSMDFVRDDRYDLVIYLVTAASGALDFYTKANNEARSESPEQTIAIDQRNAFEYIGHPNLRVIDNTDQGFGEKLSRVLRAISAFIDRVPETFYVKNYLLPAEFQFEAMHHQMEHHHFKERLTRLQPKDERKAVWYVSQKYNHFNKDPVHELVIRKHSKEDPDVFVESRQFILKGEYEKNLEQTDPAFQAIERVGVSHLYRIVSEHNVVSLGKIRVGDGEERYLLRLIRDTPFKVKSVLPGYVAGEQVIHEDPFNFVRRLKGA